MIEKLTLVTGNKGKADAYEYILGFPLKTVNVELDEIQEMEIQKIAEHKVNQAFEKLQIPVIVDDVGLYINSLNGLPGPFVKWFLKAGDGNGSLILDLMKDKEDRTAVARLAIGYHDGESVHMFSEELKGAIDTKVSEKSDFSMGFDSIFIPEGQDKPFSELPIEVKREISHRAKTLRKLKEYFDSKGK